MPRGAMKRLRVAWLAVAGALSVLSACAGQSFIYNSTLSSSYRPTDYGYGAGGRDLTTVIVGNPFAIDQAALDTKLLAILNSRPTLLQPTHFTTTPGPSARPAYRAVFYFNTAIVNYNRLCGDPAAVPKANLESKIRLTAAFCAYGGFRSSVTGEIDGITDIDDPRFAKMVGQMLILLFPPVDPSEEKDNPMFLIVRASGLAAAPG
jgi:hypothetical protein